MGEKYTLYMSLRSAFARRSRLLLEELGLNYETRVLDVFHPPATFFAVNPLGRVPALELPTGEILTDSNQIAACLRERYSFHPLFDREGVREAQALNWTALAVGVIELVVTYYLESVRPLGQRDDETMAEARANVERALTVFGDDLAKSTGPFLAGAKLKVWDLDFGAAVGYAELRMENLISSKFLSIWKYYEDMMKRPSFQKSAPRPSNP